MKRIFKRIPADIYTDEIYGPGGVDMYWAMIIRLDNIVFSVRLQTGDSGNVDFSSHPRYIEFIPTESEIELYKLLYPQSSCWFDLPEDQLYSEFCLKRGYSFDCLKRGN